LRSGWIAQVLGYAIVAEVEWCVLTNGGKYRLYLIRQREERLSPKDILESLRRLDLKIESITPTPTPSPKVRKSAGAVPSRRSPKRSKSQEKKAHFGVSLKDLIHADFLKPPLRLFRTYKGKVLEATLHPDGTVEFLGTRYPSCSTAAEAARGSVTGRRMNTNGWVFWQFREGQGQPHELIEVRQRYLESKGQA
jgi:hypothetical protein